MCVVIRKDNTRSYMQATKMKKFISESFFNPVFHVLPIISFLLGVHFFGVLIAWVLSMSIAFIEGAYIRHFYQAIYPWFIVSIIAYLFVVLTTALFVDKIPVPFNHTIGEMMAIIFLMIPRFFKNNIHRLVVNISNKKLSMENNLNELNRTALALIHVLAFYAIIYYILYFFLEESQFALKILFYIYLALIMLFFVYQTIRIAVVRTFLLKEEWVPILDDKGKEIGIIDLKTSLENKQHKLIHPVARTLIISENRILLRKRPSKDGQYANQWDNILCSHVRIKENLTEAMQRAAKTTFGFTEDLHLEYLSNYQVENKDETQYVHLFLSCRTPEIKNLNLQNNTQLKWWTIQQIESELESGIFTPNFQKEYDILQRSGLISTGSCQCECKLRDTVYKVNLKKV